MLSHGSLQNIASYPCFAPSKTVNSSPVTVSFAIINTLFWALDSIVWMDRFDASLLLKTYISSWLGNTVAYPLWFIPMYCYIIITCPLVNRIIRNQWVRLVVYLIIGIMQKALAQHIAWLGNYPFVFVAYHAFFEIGQIAFKTKWIERNRYPMLVVLLYVAIITAIARLAPEASVSVFLKFWLGNLIGIYAFFSLSQILKNNNTFNRLGVLSYPLFLLHEPLIGRTVGKQIVRFGITTTLPYIVFWTCSVLFITICLINLFQLLRIDQMLWNYRMKGGVRYER